MKISKIFLIGIFSGMALFSCRDSNEAGRGFEVDESVEKDNVGVNEGMEEEKSVAILIRENDNLSTFAESLEKNQVQQNWLRSSGQGTMTGERGSAAGQGSTNMTGNTSSQTQSSTGREGQTTNTQNQQTQSTTGGDARNTNNQNQQNSNQTHSSVQGYTIFAPSDDAFESLPEDQQNLMLDTKNRAANLASINYLMVEQRLPENLLKQQIKSANGNYSIKTLQGENLTATLVNDSIVLKDAKGNEARVIETNDQAQDGILYVIDRILLPGDLTKNEAGNTNMKK